MRRIPALLCVAGLATAPASAAANPSTAPGSRARLGVTVMTLTPELRKHFGATEDRGVLVSHVEAGTPAAAAGIEVGDVIVEVRGKKIDAAPDVVAALADVGTGDHAKIELVRDHRARTLDATLADNTTSATLLWSPPWLHDWMRPFEMHHAFGPTADEPWWFGDVMKPIDQVKSASASFVEKLKALLAPDSTGIVSQRS